MTNSNGNSANKAKIETTRLKKGLLKTPRVPAGRAKVRGGDGPTASGGPAKKDRR